MDFAKGLLEKYGWKEGQGIGRNLDGIVKPVKANLKFDTAGFGHNKADEFNNHWWEKAFNDAADNIHVQKRFDNISVTLNAGESVEYSASGYSARQYMTQKKKGITYDGTFKKSQTLDDINIARDDLNTDTPKTTIPHTHVLSDKELMEACGGRTAHKGARHGITMGGKLNRIEAQDALLLMKLGNGALYNKVLDNNLEESWTLVTKGKKRKNMEQSMDVDMEKGSKQAKLDTTIDDNIDYKIKCKSKKKKKEQRHRDNTLADVLGNLTTEESIKESNISNYIGNANIIEIDARSQTTFEKKKKKKNRGRSKERSNNVSAHIDATGQTSKHKSCKKIINCVEGNDDDNGLTINKFRKKKLSTHQLEDTAELMREDEVHKLVSKVKNIAKIIGKSSSAKKLLKEQKRINRLSRKMESSLHC